ncbi:hypothetical protein OG963_15930 [Streptomyces sp. NBC_01707]|nr:MULTISPECIES: hypothetical protein [unclassified Streptomyces]MDX3765980.1 hypothetical protein [Streptomyces sp. AK08-01B]MDX3815847.1 hypothetical protein [Streptomyces sp. AK08-01A]
MLLLLLLLDSHPAGLRLHAALRDAGDAGLRESSGPGDLVVAAVMRRG